ncbi:hypothetical protein K0504_04900 [Neiella marina]|uniref:DUF1236 domain-containing protein n=1 Tax=Neiella holothuriorum TaxID=2870530 RepID=A0ABS7EDF4_9GAMM|nr:hypothetical protein [Neiella holothuriorum]MBW8190367.1 hypothetical protein [Neiella holothuriorum]
MPQLTVKHCCVALIAMTLSISPAIAKPHSPSKKSNLVVVLKPGFRPSHKAPTHRVYHHSKMPRGAEIIIIAGITYAVIDNIYYRREQERYVFVEQPPVAEPVVVSQPATPVVSTTASQVNKGDLVELLPANAITVTISGVTFYVDGEDWYAPIAGTSKFVVVEPQL